MTLSTVPNLNYIWPQGSDLTISVTYKEGEDEISAYPVNLTNGYTVRMDMKSTNLQGAPIYTFNSDNISDVDPKTPGDQADNTKESVLGVDGVITINVPRTLTLPGGPIYTRLEGGESVFAYDLWLRNPDNKQKPLLAGEITVEKSVTLWT